MIMIKRLVLYSLIFCSSGFSLNAQQESGSSYQTVAKKVRAFFKKKKGKVFIAVTIVLLGGSAVWYFRGMSDAAVQRNSDSFVAEVQVHCKKWDKKALICCEHDINNMVVIKIWNVKNSSTNILGDLQGIAKKYSITVTKVEYQ